MGRKNRKANIKRLIALILAVLMFLGVLTAAISSIAASAASSYTYSYVTIQGDEVNVRSGPGTGYRVMSTLVSQEQAALLSSVTGTDGHTWYLIRTDWGYEGYVRSDLASAATEVYDASTVSDFDSFVSDLLSQGFPESYIPGLLHLHKLYPGWKFTAVQTGLDWGSAVAGESTLWTSMVEPGSLSSWKSTQEGAYNWSTGQWIGLDGSWVQASSEIIAYYMDPRNFFSCSGIFQFLDQKYTGTDAERESYLSGLRTMLAGSFMIPSGTETVSYSNNGETVNFVESFYAYGKATGVSPYCLASMVLTEQGITGSTMVDGNVSGYEGYYNYYNIGAYTTSTMTATQRGLWYAKGGDKGSTSYSRPWNTRAKALLGGAQFFYDQYISCGQSTLYTKRFNVTPSSPEYLYVGQYMSSVYGAAIEGALSAKGYSEAVRQSAGLSFAIPVYQNMPESTLMPLSDGTPNNTLSSLTVSVGALTPTFSGTLSNYSVVVESSVSQVTVTGTPVNSDASVSVNGAGASAAIPLNEGNNTVSVVVTASNGSTRTYTVVITRRSAAPAGTIPTANGYATSISPGTTVSTYAAGVRGVTALTVCNANGDAKSGDGILATGDTVTLTLEGGSTAVYYAVIYGDVNGDGVISNADRIKVRNYILEQGPLSGAYLAAADANHDGSVSNADRILIRNTVLGSASIRQS